MTSFPHFLPGHDSGFDVAVRDLHDGIIWARIIGELDVFTAPLLTVALAPLCGHGPEPAPVPAGGTVLLDLSALTFMDTAGLAALTDNRAALSRRGWRVCPTQSRGQVRWLLTFATTSGWLPSYEPCADFPLYADETALPIS